MKTVAARSWASVGAVRSRIGTFRYGKRKNGVASEVVWEVADLWYHTLVLLEATGVPLASLYEELAKRRK